MDDVELIATDETGNEWAIIADDEYVDLYLYSEGPTRARAFIEAMSVLGERFPRLLFRDRFYQCDDEIMRFEIMREIVHAY